MKKIYFFYTILFVFIGFFELKSQSTIVSGVVLDAKTKEAIPFATVQFSLGSFGVSTDNYGRFLIEKKEAASEIKISCIGYTTQTINIQAKQRNEVKVLLVEMEEQLKEITIRPEKYKRKNPAVDLIKQVFEHKDQNRKEGLSFYQFDTHERLRFDLNGVTEKFTKKWYFMPFKFAFDYCDTNKINQKVTLPFYLRERILTSYYRKDPFSKKDKLWAERQTAIEDDYDLDKDGVSKYINSMYSEIDIYEPNIKLLDKQFIGPLSSAATAFYRFYITDTVSIDNQRFASIYFSPINKNDLAFMGNMLISLDSTYAVKKVEMGISKDINLNWVSDIKIKQNFEFKGENDSKRLLQTDDVVIFDMKIWKNKEGRSLLVTKTNAYKNYILNQPLPDSIFKGKTVLLRDTGNLEKTEAYWEQNRQIELSEKENNVKVMVDTIKETFTFKVLSGIGHFLNTGYQRVGRIEFGQVGSMLRYNGVEGLRLQLTTRTSDRYFKHYRIRGYAAYGLLDKAWKYGGSTTFAFKGARPARFPVNQLKLSYEHDLYYPGLGSNAGQGLVNSVQSTYSNRLLLNKIAKIEYSKEYKNGFSYSLYGVHKDVSEAASETNPKPAVNTTTELGTWVRFAPNELFYQGQQERTNIRSKYPIFLAQYKAGIKGLLGGEFAYQRTSLNVIKNFYLARFGSSSCSFEAGKIFGQVSYPLLEIHRANQSYFFDDYGFNQMNYLEFVSDKYAMLHYNHDFQGILMNRLPMIKKLRLREGFTIKALYGGLSEKNTPNSQNGLLPFPLDAQNKPLTQALGKIPYMEASAGIGNIFGFLRIEYIRRLTYLDNPNVQKWGIKMMFSAGF